MYREISDNSFCTDPKQMFDREVLIDESTRQCDPQKNYLLTDLLEFDNFILLGDPGLGKTFSFETAAKHEDAVCLTVAQFRASRGRNCGGKTLFLDGLDEYRSRSAEGSLIFDLIDIITEIKPSKIRISCRSADWLGATDLSNFKILFNSNYVVASLEPLSIDQQTMILKQEGITNISEFFVESEKHGLDNLLGNPQTLIMIAKVVKTGDWPESKTELFEKSCYALLTEHDHNRTRTGIGSFRPHELVDSAGGICASILISNTHSISLLGEPEDPLVPSYRDISFLDDKKMEATLTRRAFSSSDINNDSLTYIHRIIAEFLAGKWIAEKLKKKGLMVSCVKQIIGYKNTPSSELRGLHAWISIFINANLAEQFIEADPLGIALYADPSALPPDNKIKLIRELVELSKRDPWFRSQNWSDSNLGALASEDLSDEFMTILMNPESTHHLKDLILGALRYGKPILDVGDELIKFLNSELSSIEEKIDTVYILSLMGKDRRDYLSKEYYPKVESMTEQGRRLQVSLIRSLYPEQLDVSVLSDLICKIACTRCDSSDFEIWGIDRLIMKDDLAIVLDQIIDKIEANKENISVENFYEVSEFFSLTFKRALSEDINLSIRQLWEWFKFSSQYPKHNFTVLKDETILKWVQKNIQQVDLIFDYSFSLYSNPNRWHHDFNNAFGFPYNNEELILKCLKLLNDKKYSNELALDFYAYISSLIYNNECNIQNDAFDTWYKFADENHDFRARRQLLLSCPLDSWDYRDALDRKKNLLKQRERQKRDRENVIKTLEQIEKGEHLNNIGVLAVEYFRNLTADSKPTESLVERFGEDLLPSILQGFEAILLRTDLPDSEQILRSNGKYYVWWKAILTSINEHFEKYCNLNDLEPKILETGFTLSKIFRISIRTGKNNYTQTTLDWVKHYRKEHNTYYKKLLTKLIENEIKYKVEIHHFIWDLKSCSATVEWRCEEAVKLLKKHSNADNRVLSDLLSIVLNNSKSKQELVNMADNALNKKGYLTNEKRATWLIVGYLLAPGNFLKRLKNYCKTRGFTTWIIRDLTRIYFQDSDKTGNSLTEAQLETLIICCGHHFENKDSPSGGWTGRRNDWDAAKFIRGLIDRLSTIPSKSSTVALEGISIDKKLISYRDHCLHTLFNQKRIYAENNYHQPDWEETLTFLANNKDKIEKTSVSLEDIKQSLNDFAEYVSRDKRMSFWSFDRTSNKYKWVKKPEKHGQNLLHTFLSGRYHDQINIFEEISTGAGRIDIYAQLSMKIGLVIELKMCGAPYSSTYAESGVPQISHYMKNKITDIGFLVVFDARTRDQGKGFQNTIRYNNHIIHPIVVDVRNTVRK